MTKEVSSRVGAARQQAFGLYFGRRMSSRIGTGVPIHSAFLLWSSYELSVSGCTSTSSPSWFSISHGTMFWNSGVSKIATNCEIGCGPRGSSLRPPISTANLAPIVSRSAAAFTLVSGP